MITGHCGNGVSPPLTLHFHNDTRGSASERATNAALFLFSPDLPVLEEWARGGETLEGHDCPSPAACGSVAPAEGLNGAKGGPGGQGPGSPSYPHHFMHDAWPGPPAMGEGRILRARPGRGPRNPAPFLGRTSPIPHRSSSGGGALGAIFLLCPFPS